MSKMRNGGSDVEKLAQWVGRKCRNHHPLEEIAAATKNTPMRQTGSAQGVVTIKRTPAKLEEVAILHTTGINTARYVGGPCVLLYKAGGRSFQIDVRELAPGEHANTPRESVGF